MQPHPIFAPKLLGLLRGYDRKTFRDDLIAGVIVGVVALPLALAFAIASGVAPEAGLATAIVAGFLISALGGSRVQIGGPTGAFVGIVYAIVTRHGMPGLQLCTLMAGVLLVLMGVFRFGAFIRFIPYPLTVGFTSGIAVIIFSQQIKDLFGLQTGPVPAEFVEKWHLYIDSAHTASWPTAGISLFGLLVMLFWPRVSRRVPNSLVCVLGSTALVSWFKLPVETIGSRFGALPAALPTPHLPSVDFQTLRGLISPAFTVALLAAIESLLSATVADAMIEGRHRPNTELIAQGLANLAVPLFGGIPATGAIARTATNVKNGAKTPVAGIVHAATLLMIVLALGKWVQAVPLCALAVVLVVVSYHMSEWRTFRSLLRAPRMDIAVLVTTFALTVLVDLTVAVEVGMLLSMALFMMRMTDVTVVREVTRELAEAQEDEAARRAEPSATSRRHIPEGVSVFEAEGAFFFGVASSLRDTLGFGTKPPKVLILRVRHVLALDASGLRALEELHRSCKRAGTQLLLSGVQAQPLRAMQRGGLEDSLGAANILKTFDEALARARALV